LPHYEDGTILERLLAKMNVMQEKVDANHEGREAKTGQ
jgi:hypothetical protein